MVKKAFESKKESMREQMKNLPEEERQAFKDEMRKKHEAFLQEMEGKSIEEKKAYILSKAQASN